MPTRATFNIFVSPDGKRKAFVVSWSEKGRGFGEYAFFERDGKMMIDNECDSKESVKRVLCALIDDCVLTSG